MAGVAPPIHGWFQWFGSEWKLAKCAHYIVIIKIKKELSERICILAAQLRIAIWSGAVR